MHALGVAFRRVLDILLVALFSMSAALVLGGFALPRVGHQLIIINGGSMAPAIPHGAAVIVAEKPAALAPGDIVTIRDPSLGVVFTHRIVQVLAGSEATLRTRGDANESADPTTVPSSWVVGRVDTIVPDLGYLVAFVQSAAGRGALIALMVLLLAVRWLIDDLLAPDSADEGATASADGSSATPQSTAIPMRPLSAGKHESA